MSPRTVRIFISSPGDVEEERAHAKRVIDGLQRRYPQATLHAVLWEDLALPATASFQESIDLLLERTPVDVAIFILWSRLGTALTDATRKNDGSPYLSGTEREFDLMLAAFERSDRKRPLILAYRRKDDPGFQRTLVSAPEREWSEIIRQRELARSFVTERFRDSQGRNLRALLSYRRPIDFSDRLRVHLRNALDDLLDHEDVATWTGDPYRGLEVFEAAHAGIFFGRDDEVCRILKRLRGQSAGGCAFVAIIGASGSGKSSLARAGVAAAFADGAALDKFAAAKCATIVPTLTGEDPIAGLTHGIVGAVPAIARDSSEMDALVAGLHRDPDLTVKLRIAPSLKTGNGVAGGIGLLIVVDQMEELWTDRRIAAEMRDRFLAALEALARCGSIYVLATLRSDFYGAAQQVSAFLRMKGERGHFDLVAPTAASLQKAIVEPARAAGLRFETDESTGRTLDQAILEDALSDPASLPHLQFVLRELYERHDEKRRTLTFAAYESLERLGGALRVRAEEVYRSLSPEAKGAFYEILPSLVAVGSGEGEAAVRRRANAATLKSSPARTQLFEALVRARFLTAEGENDVATAQFAHEAMLCWRRISEWIDENRDWLRVRRRTEAAKSLWEESRRDPSLLLQPGLPLEAGKALLVSPIGLEDEGLENYVATSIRSHQDARRRARVVRLAAASAIGLFLLIATVAGTLAWSNYREANRQKEAKERVAYFERIVRISTELEAARTSSAIALMRDLPTEREPIEARMLRALAEGSPLRLVHENASAMEIRGDVLITGGTDGSLRRWDLTNGKMAAQVLLGRKVNDIAIARDGSVVTVDSAGRLSVRDGDSLEESVGLSEGVPLTSVTLLYEGAHAVVGSASGDIRIRELPELSEIAALSGTDERIAATTDDAVESILDLTNFRGGQLAFARGGLLASWNYGEDRVEFSTRSGGTIKRLSSDLCSQTQAIFGFAESATGRPGELGIFSVASGEKLAFSRGVNDVGDVSASCEGQVVAGTKDGAVLLFQVGAYHEATNAERPAPIENLRTLHGHAHPIVRISGHPSDRKIATADAEGVIKVWSLDPPFDAIWPFPIDAYAVSPGKSQIALAYERGIVILDLDAGVERRYIVTEEPVRDIEFDPSGGHVAVVYGARAKLDIWNVESGELSNSFDLALAATTLEEDGAVVRQVDRIGDSIVLLDSGGAATGVDLRGSGELIPIAEDVQAMAPSNESSRLVLLMKDGALREWEISQAGSTEIGRVANPDAVFCMVSRPGSREVAVGRADGVASIVDLDSGEARDLPLPHAGAVTSLAYTQDGLRLLSASSDGVLRVSEASTGTMALTLRGQFTDLRIASDSRGLLYVDSVTRRLKSIDCRERSVVDWWMDNAKKAAAPRLAPGPTSTDDFVPSGPSDPAAPAEPGPILTPVTIG